MGSDQCECEWRCRLCVSTHAPTWGATSDVCPFIHSFQEFQPTLPHGERLLWCHHSRLCRSFNPRSRMGSDFVGDQFLCHTLVSTHAPAWGATARTEQLLKMTKVSTHAPAWGATAATSVVLPVQLFQPTLPHGERPLGSIMMIILTLFQPTLPHGERLKYVPIVLFSPVAFQPTLPHGERRSLIRRKGGT